MRGVKRFAEGTSTSSAAALSRRWLVIKTKSRQERVAMHHLTQRGVEPYCPMYLEPPWHPRAPRGPMPLFANYLFVRRPHEERLNAVKYCPGVLRPLTFDGELASVDEEIIDALKVREGERGYILPEEVLRGIKAGQQVQIMAGPLRGMSGVFCGYLRGRERATVLLEFLRTRCEVEVDSDFLQIDPS